MEYGLGTILSNKEYGNDDKENIEYAALQILAVLRTCKIRVGSVRAVFNEVERKIQQIARV